MTVYAGEDTVAVKKSAGRWAGGKKSGGSGAAAKGKRKAQDDRRLQDEAEARRSAGSKSKKEGKEGAVQAGQRRYPEPPVPKQHLEKPGRESELEPRP
ncbi:MAG TPA: hypothetical protein VEB59_02960, partial [Gemmatimonadales bacterium]|nr:hypothetical protein [Gemmatimonadales bacterium]